MATPSVATFVIPPVFLSRAATVRVKDCVHGSAASQRVIRMSCRINLSRCAHFPYRIVCDLKRHVSNSISISLCNLRSRVELTRSKSSLSPETAVSSATLNSLLHHVRLRHTQVLGCFRSISSFVQVALRTRPISQLSNHLIYDIFNDSIPSLSTSCTCITSFRSDVLQMCSITA